MQIKVCLDLPLTEAAAAPASPDRAAEARHRKHKVSNRAGRNPVSQRWLLYFRLEAKVKFIGAEGKPSLYGLAFEGDNRMILVKAR